MRHRCALVAVGESRQSCPGCRQCLARLGNPRHGLQSPQDPRQTGICDLVLKPFTVNELGRILERRLPGHRDTEGGNSGETEKLNLGQGSPALPGLRRAVTAHNAIEVSKQPRRASETSGCIQAAWPRIAAIYEPVQKRHAVRIGMRGDHEGVPELVDLNCICIDVDAIRAAGRGSGVVTTV